MMSPEKDGMAPVVSQSSQILMGSNVENLGSPSSGRSLGMCSRQSCSK